jgi:hypothetical protein
MAMTQRDQIHESRWENRFAAIEAEAEAILKSEGKHRVAGRHFALEKDAHMARMIEAEARVARRDASMIDYWHRVQGSRI